MHKRSDEKYCLKIIEEIYPLRIFPLYLFKIVEEDLVIIYKTYNCDGDVYYTWQFTSLSLRRQQCNDLNGTLKV